MTNSSAENPIKFVCSVKDPIDNQVYIIEGTYNYSKEDELFVAHITPKSGVNIIAGCHAETKNQLLEIEIPETVNAFIKAVKEHFPGEIIQFTLYKSENLNQQKGPEEPGQNNGYEPPTPQN